MRSCVRCRVCDVVCVRSCVRGHVCEVVCAMSCVRGRVCEVVCVRSCVRGTESDEGLGGLVLHPLLGVALEPVTQRIQHHGVG